MLAPSRPILFGPWAGSLTAVSLGNMVGKKLRRQHLLLLAGPALVLGRNKKCFMVLQLRKLAQHCRALEVLGLSLCCCLLIVFTLDQLNHSWSAEAIRIAFSFCFPQWLPPFTTVQWTVIEGQGGGGGPLPLAWACVSVWKVCMQFFPLFFKMGVFVFFFQCERIIDYVRPSRI